ncbi:protein trapped in endoderm-1 [Ischnura elegans]|uniref:protein trapped in endoderm-1 n=1 Tax=Ischnura elegans TaxID=197161 RepID=UPI001ED8B0B6|nr:protein trapped in endoderm-1 [Ischnura elegans]
MEYATSMRNGNCSGQSMESCVSPYPRPATLFASAAAILFIAIGVTGNLITALALLRCSKLRGHATTAFVISLSFSDLLFCATNLPLTASRYINEAWVLGDTLCKLFPFFFYGNVAVSLMNMVAITINRYILIACRSYYDRLYTRKYIALMLAFAWLFSFSMMVPPLAGYWGQFGLHAPTFSCTILKKNGLSPKKFLFVFGFFLPCVVIITSYTCIYWKVRQSRLNLQSYSTNGAVTCSQQNNQRREDIRLTRMMTIIFSCFLLCFLPLMLVNVVDDEVKYPTVHVLASVLAWASSVVNPFIYAGSNRQYRAAYRELFLGPPKIIQIHKSSATQSGSGRTTVTEMRQCSAVKSHQNAPFQ